MPGNVAIASPTTTLPAHLARAYTRTHTFALNSSVYKSGEYQTALLVENSRTTWKLTQRLSASDADALTAFYLARGGAAQPFHFVEIINGVSGGTPKTVRFEGGFTQTMNGPGSRSNSEFTLIEIA